MELKKTNNIFREQVLPSIFIMITSALGPAFLTQTATFTEQYGASFAFAIVVSLIISLGAQLNVWRILTVSESYAQDASNKVLPGLGYVISFFIVLGGLAFNIGNVSGAGLGFNAIFGMDYRIGAVLTGVGAIAIFMSKRGQSLVDKLIQLLGILMLILSLYVAIVSRPPVGEAVLRTFAPEDMGGLVVPTITLAGGTVGGYITFSGAHKLIDGGVSGKGSEKVSFISALSGIIGSGIMRFLLFFSVLGVTATGLSLDQGNPAASAFQLAIGRPGEIIFGIILLAAGISSVIGAAYTSASFLKTYHPIFEEKNSLVIVAFIAVSTVIFIFVGQPVTLLILAGAFNGLILPLTLGATLAGAYRKDIVGDYKHPKWLTIFGIITILVTLYIGISSLSGLAALWQG